MKNIVLIGMPGCGKSTIGKLLRKETGLKLIDLDEYIVENSGMTIEEMFQQGESFFRNKETKAVKKVSQHSGVIISTGGGVIKREENMQYLKENGIIIFINRSPEKIIETINNSVRPLLKDGIKRVYELYEERYELYMKYSDKVILNEGLIDTVVHNVKEIVGSLKQNQD